MAVLIAGAIAAAAIIFLILKFGRITRILAFDKWIDVGTTIIIGIMFFGTFSGMMVAVTAGCIVSAFLYFAKMIFGAEKLTLRGWKQQQQPKRTKSRNPIKDYVAWRQSWKSFS